MTDQLQAARDEIAEMCGLPNKIEQYWTDKHGDICEYVGHPIPACLNFVSRVWPEGWGWSYGSTPEHGWRWTAKYLVKSTHDQENSTSINIEMGDSELTDRMTLLLKVLKWLRDNDRPAFDAACEKIRKEIQG